MAFARISFSFLFIIFFQFAFAQNNGELLIIVQANKSISNNLLKEDLTAIKRMAVEQDLAVKIVELDKQNPMTVDFTPTIIFQNHRGRSNYRGRYKAIDRLTNFVRTAKWQVNKSKFYHKSEILTYSLHKTTLAAPIKITSLKGDLPVNYDNDEFVEAAQKAIIKGMNKMQFQKSVELPAAARLFYMDFHPYRSKKGELFINTSLYSMFSCAAPVFESHIPLKGTYKNMEQLFQAAGQLLETQLFVQLENIQNGDGLELLNSGNTQTTLDDLGYSLPKQSMKETIVPNNIEITNDQWIFDQPFSKTSPALQFQFPAPLDHYSGEAKQMTIQLQLREGQNFRQAKGKVKVATQSITMGDKALDDHILNEYILADKFPLSTYDFIIVSGPDSLTFGTSQAIQLEGNFQMSGIETPIRASGTVELTLNKVGEPRLHIMGKFDLALLELFGIKGPDGPKEASNMLQFRLNFLMKPADDFTAVDNFDSYAKLALASKEVVVKQVNEKQPKNQNSSISWKASTSVYKAKGSFEKWEFTQLHIPNGDLEKITATVLIDLNSIKEKSKMLVKHVKSDKFFDVEKYPMAELIIKNSIQKSTGNYQGEALLNLKGISASVPFTFEVISTAPLIIKGNCAIDRSVFSIGKVKNKGGVSRYVAIEIFANLDNALNARGGQIASGEE